MESYPGRFVLAAEQVGYYNVEPLWPYLAVTFRLIEIALSGRFALVVGLRRHRLEVQQGKVGKGRPVAAGLKGRTGEASLAPAVTAEWLQGALM